MIRRLSVPLKSAVAGLTLLCVQVATADDTSIYGTPQAGRNPRWADTAYPPGASGQAPGPRPPVPSDTGAPPSTPGGATGQAQPSVPSDSGAPPSTAPSTPGATAPGAPSPEAAQPSPTAPATAPSALEAAAAAGGAAPFSGLGGGTAGGGAGAVAMLGDESPGIRLTPLAFRTRQVQPPAPPTVPPPGRPPTPGVPPGGVLRGFTLASSIRQPKIADNQSPQPQDRVYVNFNYFEDVNRSVNQRIGSSLYNFRVYRELFGFEKTVLDGNGSIGLRMPLNTLSAASYTPFGGGTSTSVGDLSVILKYAFWWDRETNNLFSGGLMLNTPTGTRRFAGFPNIIGPHYMSLTPWVGYIYNFNEDLYFQAFNSINVPVNNNDVTVLYNDFGLGYFLYRAPTPDALLTMISPTFETHVNIPLNHNGGFDPGDPAWTPNVVNLTFGCNFGIGRNGLLAAGYVCPVTGPRPFDNEWLVYLTYRF